MNLVALDHLGGTCPACVCIIASQHIVEAMKGNLIYMVVLVAFARQKAVHCPVCGAPGARGSVKTDRQ